MTRSLIKEGARAARNDPAVTEPFYFPRRSTGVRRPGRVTPI